MNVEQFCQAAHTLAADTHHVHVLTGEGSSPAARIFDGLTTRKGHIHILARTTFDVKHEASLKCLSVLLGGMLELQTRLALSLSSPPRLSQSAKKKGLAILGNGPTPGRLL